MHLYLIGYRGSGKSTVGRALAQRLGLPAIDTDDLIEAGSGLSVREIFAAEGESGFRQREASVIAEVAARPLPCVVSLGGGAILRETNRKCLSVTGNTVWLQAPAEQLFRRIEGDATSQQRRPSLSDRGGFAEVVELLAAREPLYRELAQKIVLTEGRTPDDVVEEIVDWVKSRDSAN